MEFLRIITLQLLAPIICINATNHPGVKCYIIKKDYKDRIHCYNLKFPFFLKYSRYSCHGKYFTAFDPQLVQRYPSNLKLDFYLVIFGKIVMVILIYFLHFTFYRFNLLLFILFRYIVSFWTLANNKDNFQSLD
jgi:hypothetical protein